MKLGTCLLLLSLFTSLSNGQNVVASGTDQGIVYTNDAHGLTWQLPKDWITEPNQPTQTSSGTTEILLKASTPTGGSATLIVEDHRDTPGFSAIYSDLMKEKLEKDGWEVVGQRRYRTIGKGVPGVDDRFKVKGNPPAYVAMICGGHRGYELKFGFRADSPEKLDEMVIAIGAVKIRPDWSSGETAAPPPDPSRPQMVRVSQRVSDALITRKIQPEYPAEARSKGVQGSVLMVMHINTTGHVQDLFIIEGEPLLSPAALRAVSQWEFKPYLLNAQAVAVETQARINFTLGR